MADQKSSDEMLDNPRRIAEDIRSAMERSELDPVDIEEETDAAGKRRRRRKSSTSRWGY